MIGDQLVRIGTETGKMRNTDSFAWRLRQARDAMGITQFEMCDKIKAVIRREEPTFDLSYPAYNKYETGDTATPRLNVLSAISEITELSLDYLVSGREKEKEERFATTEAEQIAAIVDSLPIDLRTPLLEGARLLQRMSLTLQQTQIEEALFLNKIKTLLPEQERIKAQSILDKINRTR